jgi:YidC/Oxa1 family membrane protein insertase
MYDDDGKPLPLTLAPPYRVRSRKNNEVDYQKSAPSSHYTLYHYAKPDAEYPVDTLGKVVWKVEKRSLDGDEQSVTFGVDVPGQKIHVTKTFTLKPGDYHLGLKIGVENKADDGKPIKFRYQLEGAHDLPIEGKWYTSIYRNALVGGEDKNHYPWRSLEDARQIGHWQGGESHDKQDNTIRYAGTATQYFASMVVVAEKENQPTGGDDFVKRVRATVEGPLNKEKPFLDDFVVRLISDPLALDAGKPIEHDYLLYNGPLKVRLLGQLRGEQAVDPALVERYETKLGLASCWAGSITLSAACCRSSSSAACAFSC